MCIANATALSDAEDHTVDDGLTIAQRRRPRKAHTARVTHVAALAFLQPGLGGGLSRDRPGTREPSKVYFETVQSPPGVPEAFRNASNTFEGRRGV